MKKHYVQFVNGNTVTLTDAQLNELQAQYTPGDSSPFTIVGTVTIKKKVEITQVRQYKTY